VRLEGPDVDLSPREALALGMVLHELATNAVKYGGLSTPSGCVRVSWTVVPGRPAQLVLEWAEAGGPPVTAPARRGFGSRMVQGAVSGELGGTAALDFAPDGFRCKLSAPLDLRQGEADLAAGAAAGVRG
jgi:diguanylate cyclase